MELEEFRKKLDWIYENYAADEIDVSPDFQCDQTGGFPTCLCVCWPEETAWLALNETIASNDPELYENMCAEFGFRYCPDVQAFNSILKNLSADAYQTAYLPED